MPPSLDATADRELIRGYGRSLSMERVVSIALVALACVVVVSIALIAAAHVDDRYAVNHVSGSWMSLAQAARDGTLYPPLFDGSNYGGTRFMPLPILLHAGAASVTGEFLVSGKLIAYLLTVILYGLTFLLLRRSNCSRTVSLALVAACLVTPTGLVAATSVRGDSLALILQLAALLLLQRVQTPTRLAGAGVLCALAAMAKLSALWAPIAILIWLFFNRQRRSAVVVLSTCIGAVAALMAIFAVASSGRIIDNLQAFALAGSSGSDAGPLAGLSTLLRLTITERDAAWFLLPVAAVAVVRSVAKSRSLTLFQISLLIEGLILLVVLRDVGADFNHLLDLTVLLALVTGEFWADLRRSFARRPRFAALAVAAIVFTGTALAYAETVRAPTSEAIRSFRSSAIADYSTRPLHHWVTDRTSLLSEDPAIPVLLGEHPVVEDPFMLLRLGRTHPQWAAALVRRVEHREFDRIVLLVPVDDHFHFAHEDFGANVAAAIASNYRLVAKVPDRTATYWVYGRAT